MHKGVKFHWGGGVISKHAPTRKGSWPMKSPKNISEKT